MPTQAEIIHKAMVKARNDWVAWTVTQEAEMIHLYEAAGGSIIEQIAGSTKANAIMKARRKSLLAEIDLELQRLRASLNYKIKSQMRQSIDAGIASGIHGMQVAGIKGNVQIGSSYLGADGKIRRYDSKITTLAASPWGKINKSAMDFLIRYRPTGLEFADSIWEATWDVQKRMRFMVNQAVLIGTSSQNLARDLKQFVSKRGLKVGPGVYKTAYKNAWRLARTEMNRAYIEGQLRYVGKKSWIDGIIWRLGNDDACEICEGYADQFYAQSDVPPMPHPNCMCWMEYHIADEEAGETQAA